MIINRKWCMPNKNTFEIKPIKELIQKYIDNELSGIHGGVTILDPFSNGKRFNNNYSIITNDLDLSLNADYSLDALDFLKLFPNNSIDMVLFDPPYSPRQVSECYKKLDKTVNMQTTQSSYWSNLKKEISRITKQNGIVVSCAWNSGGIGKTLCFNIEEILLVPHGGWHNDTIITIERKMRCE